MIQSTSVFKTNHAICFIVAYPVDSVINLSFRTTPDNSPPGQFAPDLQTNSPSFFYPSQSQKRCKCMIPKLNAIEIILRSFIHNQTNYSSFCYPLPSLKFGDELSGANCPGGELSDIRITISKLCKTKGRH